MSHEELGVLPIDVRVRLAMIAGVEEAWHDGTGAPMTDAELRREIARFEMPPPRHVPRVQERKAAGDR